MHVIYSGCKKVQSLQLMTGRLGIEISCYFLSFETLRLAVEWRQPLKHLRVKPGTHRKIIMVIFFPIFPFEQSEGYTDYCDESTDNLMRNSCCVWCVVLKGIWSTWKDVGTAPLSYVEHSISWIVLVWYRHMRCIPTGQTTWQPVECEV